MNVERKKALKSAYREKPTVGGVYCIRCSGNGRLFVQPNVNIEGVQNRYQFAVSMGTCPDPSLRGEWERYGAESFSFTVLDELKKSEAQTQKEFVDDLNALYEIWLEKARSGDLD